MYRKCFISINQIYTYLYHITYYKTCNFIYEIKSYSYIIFLYYIFIEFIKETIFLQIYSLLLIYDIYWFKFKKNWNKVCIVICACINAYFKIMKKLIDNNKHHENYQYNNEGLVLYSIKPFYLFLNISTCYSLSLFIEKIFNSFSII